MLFSLAGWHFQFLQVQSKTEKKLSLYPFTARDRAIRDDGGRLDRQEEGWKSIATHSAAAAAVAATAASTGGARLRKTGAGDLS